MEKKSRRKFSADFKAKVALEVIRERHTVEERRADKAVWQNLKNLL